MCRNWRFLLVDKDRAQELIAEINQLAQKQADSAEE